MRPMLLLCHPLALVQVVNLPQVRSLAPARLNATEGPVAVFVASAIFMYAQIVQPEVPPRPTGLTKSALVAYIITPPDRSRLARVYLTEGDPLL